MVFCYQKKEIMRVIIKSIKIVILVLFFFLLVTVVLSFIKVGKETLEKETSAVVYLRSNGVHVDFVLPNQIVLQDIKQSMGDAKYYAIGWGDKDFFLQVRLFNELGLSVLCRALFVPSESLIHVVRLNKKESDWREIKLSSRQIENLNNYIYNAFEKGSKGELKKIKGFSYGKNDAFYQATGSYTILNTCNTWVNKGLKQCGLKASIWTPYSFTLVCKE